MMDRKTFEARLRRFSRTRRGIVNGTLVAGLLGLALVAGLLVLLLLSGHVPGVLLNLALFVVFALSVPALFLVWLIRRERFRSPLAEAFHLEELSGGLNSLVVSAWDFLQQEQPAPLEAAVIARASADVVLPHEAALDRTLRNRLDWVAQGLLIVVFLVGSTDLFGFSRVMHNLHQTLRGLDDLLNPPVLSIEPGPGIHIHRLRDKVVVTLKSNRLGGDAVLTETVGDESTDIPVTLDEYGSASLTITSAVEVEKVLTFQVGDRTTEATRLIFTTPPELVNMQTELVYPRYTRLPPRSLESVQQRLLALPGTGMTLGFTFTKDLDRATITWDDGSELPLEVVGRFATTNLTHSRSRTATLQVRDLHGLPLDQPLTIDFEVQHDEKPQVMLPRHLKDNMPLLESEAKLFGFGVQASDDYGVTRILLRWQKSTVDNPAGVLERGEVERLISPAQPRATVAFDKVFEGMNLKPGDRIGFQVDVQDNREPTKQTTPTRRCSFFVYQENLGDLTVRELGFGSADPLARERIARATRATTVKEPEGLKSKEDVRNKFEAAVMSGTQSPIVRGEHAQAVRDYFRLLSTVKYPEPEGKKP